MILIGSQAAKLQGTDLARRTNENEYDIIGTREEMEIFISRGFVAKESVNFPGKFKLNLDEIEIEYDATGNESNILLFKDAEGYDVYDILDDIEVDVPDDQVLYLIKRSHANFSVHFEKTIHDLKALSKKAFVEEYAETKAFTLRQAIFDCDPELEPIYNLRHEEAKARFGKIQERIKLNKSNEEFFKGGANLRVYEHDDIHRAVAYFTDRPMFERCKWDMNSAKIDRDLFQRLHPHMKIMMVQEESMVIGIERFGLQTKEAGAKKIYNYGLMKLTRDLCKGWFQDFILDNILALEESQWDFMARFSEALEANKVRKVKNRA